MVNGTCDASIETDDELGTTRMSEFRVIFRVVVELIDAATREVSLRAIKCGRGRGRSHVTICLATNTAYSKPNRLKAQKSIIIACVNHGTPQNA